MRQLQQIYSASNKAVPVALLQLWCAAGSAYFADPAAMTGRFLDLFTQTWAEKANVTEDLVIMALEQSLFCPRLLKGGKSDLNGKFKDARCS